MATGDDRQVVGARDVLAAVLAVRRIGRRRALEELEAAEPDLAEYALEELTAIRHRMADLGGRAADVRRLGGRVEALALVLVTAVRAARLRLWRADDDDDDDDRVRDEDGNARHEEDDADNNTNDNVGEAANP